MKTYSKDYYKKWNKKNRDKRRQYEKNWNDKNKERTRETARNSYYKRKDKVTKYRNQPEIIKMRQDYQKEYLSRSNIKEQKKRKIREYQLIKKYNLTIEQHNKILASQDNRCDICKETFIDTPRVDHDHTTGKVRGLLCSQCNTSIGGLRDSILIVESALNYLKKHKEF